MWNLLMLRGCLPYILPVSAFLQPYTSPKPPLPMIRWTLKSFMVSWGDPKQKSSFNTKKGSRCGSVTPEVQRNDLLLRLKSSVCKVLFFSSNPMVLAQTAHQVQQHIPGFIVRIIQMSGLKTASIQSESPTTRSSSVLQAKCLHRLTGVSSFLSLSLSLPVSKFRPFASRHKFSDKV